MKLNNFLNKIKSLIEKEKVRFYLNTATLIYISFITVGGLFLPSRESGEQISIVDCLPILSTWGLVIIVYVSMFKRFKRIHYLIIVAIWILCIVLRVIFGKTVGSFIYVPWKVHSL